LDDSDARASGVWPDLEALARPSRERRRLPPDTRSRIILDLCERAPLSVKELSLLLDRSEAYVGDAIRPLVTAGNLTFLYPDQPRHPKQKYLAAATQPIRSREIPKHVTPVIAAPALEPVAETRIFERPAPEQIHSQTQPPLEPPAPAPSRFPNQVTNIVVVVLTGILLATLRTSSWFLFALLTALALSLAHIIAHSSQYEKFRVLQAPKQRGLLFMLLKSGVAVMEIVLVYYAASAFTS
jgi:hypothetical protein